MIFKINNYLILINNHIKKRHILHNPYKEIMKYAETQSYQSQPGFCTILGFICISLAGIGRLQ